jgi:tetratricopeptide (TPR) repeat protein
MLPGNSEIPEALAAVTRREGNWDESIVYLEEALALDPRNVVLLDETALTYVMLRQFPAALKLYDRALDILPNDSDVVTSKASIHQAQGNLDQAAKFLSGITMRTPSENAFRIKMTQLRLERNYDEAIRLLQARQAQFHLVLRSTGALIRPCWLSRSALPAILLGQKLRLNMRATHWHRSAKINQKTPSLRTSCLWLMPFSGRRTRP